MLFQKTTSYCIALLLAFSLHAAAQHVPTPKEHFGFAIGDDYQLATYTQTEAYFKKLAATSDRVKLVEIGKTEEGRAQYMLIVSSPENLKHLDRYKSISQQLAHAETLTDDQAHRLAQEGKTVVWIDGGLHATETVGTHQLIETAYQLASRTDDETLRILDQEIILLTHANPDGQELVSGWYMQEKNPLKRSYERVPLRYEKWAGHDNNRDFYMVNLKETQNMARQLYVEWFPQILYNHHQAGPVGSVVAGPPYRDPFNYLFDPLVVTTIDAVGAAMINRLNTEGKPGYTERTGSSFSTWYNGGLRTTMYFHNMVGLLTEIQGSPTPSTIPLVPQRLIPSGATPFPVTPREWHFRDAIDYSLSLNYAVLDYARRYHDELLFNAYRMGRNSIERGSKDYWTLSPSKVAKINQLYQDGSKATASKRAGGADSTASRMDANTVPVKYYDSVMKNPASRDPRCYILSSRQPDFPTAVRFVNALIRTGIVVQKATADFEVNDKHYPAGSFVIKTDQAFRPHVLDMFEPQDHPNDFAYPGGPPIAPYDAAGWTLAYTMGVQFDRVLEEVRGPFERIPYGEEQHIQGSVTGTGAVKGYLIDGRINQSFVLANDILKQGIELFRLTGPAKETKAVAGSFFVPFSAKAKTLIEKAVSETGISVTKVANRPAGLEKISKARIAVWDSYGGSIDSGWLQFILEQHHYLADVVFASALDSVDLCAKYDVILFASGAIPTANAAPNGFRRRTEMKADEVPAPYRRMVGRVTAEKTIPALKRFMEKGGSIVTIGNSSNLAYQLGLPVHDALVEMVNTQQVKLPREKFYIPGSVLRMSVDSTNQACWGMGKEADVYFDSSPVFSVAPEATLKGIVKPLAWYASNHPLRSGWAWGEAYLQDGVAAFVASVGEGKLFAFGPEITFRSQTHGTFKLLFNELYVNSPAK